MHSINIKPIVYSFPDSDSDSDIEDYTPVTEKYSPIDLLEQRTRLIQLGCSDNLLDEYKRVTKTYVHKEYDNTDILNRIEHQNKLNEERQKILQRQRTEQENEINRLKQLLNKTYDIENEDDDKAFEAQLKKQREQIDQAIALDRQKQETDSLEAKARIATEIKAREDRENEKKEKERKEREERERAAESMKLKQSSATSPAGLAEYQEYYKKIDYYKSNIKPLLDNPPFRKQCFEAKRLIKRTLTQLQYKHDVILAKYNILHKHLLTIKQQSAEAFEVMLNELSKAFLLQVKQEIHATPFAAYFLGRFAYLLCSTIPEFQDYLLGRLFKRCPYLVPQYHDDDSSLSQDEIKSRLRYRYSNKEKKTLETFLQHAEMQKCYVMFYGGLCQTLPDPGQPPNPLPIKHAWIWLARICNMPPREITPILVLGMLKITGIRLLEQYPHQTPKLFRLIRQTLCPMFPVSEGKDNKSSIEQLQMFLDDYFTKGILECVPESLPPSI